MRSILFEYDFIGILGSLFNILTLQRLMSSLGQRPSPDVEMQHPPLDEGHLLDLVRSSVQNLFPSTFAQVDLHFNDQFYTLCRSLINDLI